MFVNIVLALFLCGAIYYDYTSVRNAKITPDTKAIINLKRKYFRIEIILFVGFMIYAIINGSMNNTYSVFTLSLSLVLVLLVLKITFINKQRIIITNDELICPLGRLPLAAISLFTLDEKGRLLIKIQNAASMTFTPKEEEDYKTIVYAAEKLNVGNSQEIIKFHRLAQIASIARGVFPMTGVIKDYDWGGKHFIAEQLGLEPQQAAELWLGTHPSGMSYITLKGKYIKQLADQFYAEFPEQTRIEIDTTQDYNILTNFNLAYGQPLRSDDMQRSDELPFLFKILDVARPLSIQIHPDKETAERGYVNEDRLGISLSDPKRTFKDKNHKPELMVALTDFYLLHGFASKEQILAKLEGKVALTKFKELVETTELPELYEQLMRSKPEELKELFADHINSCVELYSKLVTKQLTLDDILTPVEIDGINSEQVLLDPDYWTAFSVISTEMSVDKIDVGIACYYLFNLLKLEPYQGIFQASNVPHAYLRGRNFEVMATSDNVIRGGLTTKYINKTLLIEFTDTDPVVPNILPAGNYPVPVTDFTAEIVKVEGEEKVHRSCVTIMYVLSGKVEIYFKDQNHTPFTLNGKIGSSYLITAGQNLTLKGNADVVFASCPTNAQIEAFTAQPEAEEAEGEAQASK